MDNGYRGYLVGLLKRSKGRRPIAAGRCCSSRCCLGRSRSRLKRAWGVYFMGLLGANRVGAGSGCGLSGGGGGGGGVRSTKTVEDEGREREGVKLGRESKYSQVVRFQGSKVGCVARGQRREEFDD